MPQEKSTVTGGEVAAKKKKKGLFGRSIKSKEDVLAADGTVVRKNKKFKRIRGFITGETRRERRARRLAAKKAKLAAAGKDPAAAELEDYDDASTIYGVDVDERSLASAAAPPASSSSAPPSSPDKKNASMLGTPVSSDESTPDHHEAFFAGAAAANNNAKPYLLKVVLLLMDPNTRRFELLQLEFDSNKALVNDVLKQIHVSVTEEALRAQNYTGICGKAATTMPPNKLLAEFCAGNDVLVAIPDGVTAKECARLAKPILSDEKVGAMVRI